MKKKLAIILCIVMIVTLTPATSYAAKKVKSKSVTIAPKSMILAVGDIAQLNATVKPNNTTDRITWTTSDEAICTVTSKGVVQGKASGTATITAKTSSKKTGTCTVEVKQYAVEPGTSTDSTGIFELIKDKILELIKSTSYTKSEVDNKIASSGGTTVINQYDFVSPNKFSDIEAYPNKSCVMKSVYVNGERDEKTGERSLTTTDVNLNKIELSNLKTITYEEFLDETSRDETRSVWGNYFKYSYDVSISGSVNADLQGSWISYQLSSSEANYDGVYSNPVDKEPPTVNADGTFSFKLEVKTNKLPKELYLVYMELNAYTYDDWI